jgi:predicted metal-dependent phosphoesterase TrpH
VIRADFHVHSVYSPDSLLQLADIKKIVLKRKIDCIAITDHNTMDGAKRLMEMDLPCRLIIGEEISTADGEIIGLFLQETIPANQGAMRTIELIREQGGVVVLPHPCDRLRRHVLHPSLWNDVVPAVDLVESFNGRTVFFGDDLQAAELARKYGKPLIAGSDSHTPWELGWCGIEMDDFQNIDQFRTVIGKGKFFGNRTALWAHIITKLVKYANRTGLRQPVKGC